MLSEKSIVVSDGFILQQLVKQNVSSLFGFNTMIGHVKNQEQVLITQFMHVALRNQEDF